MSDDPWESPEMKAWARHALDDAAPKIRDSALTISLVPKGETDIKFAVELGLSIMFDKPIMLVVEPGTQLPLQLVKVASEIVEGDIGDPSFHERLQAAMLRIVGDVGRES